MDQPNCDCLNLSLYFVSTTKYILFIFEYCNVHIGIAIWKIAL